MTRRRLTAVTLLVSVAALALTITCFVRRTPALESPRLGLTLLVNRQPRVEITSGTPLIFELSLGSSALTPPFNLGHRWAPWHTLGRIESAHTGTPPWALTKAAQRSVKVSRQADGRHQVTVDTAVVARLEAGRQVHTVTWTAGPEETSRIQPGTYHVRGVLETPFWMVWGWRGRAVSDAITIVVRSAGASSEFDTQRLVETAGYYVSLGRFAEAHAAATELIKLEPREANAHILLGDALAGLNRPSEALEAYHRAMSLLPRAAEEPTLLYRRIASVRNAAKQ